jgi:hypothetical protein
VIEFLVDYGCSKKYDDSFAMSEDKKSVGSL